MKFKKEYAILLFIIAVLVFYISSNKSDRTHYDLPQIQVIQKADISKIAIKKKGTDIVLTKEGDRWVVGPEEYPASDTAIEKMIDSITTLKLTAMVSESKNYELYELDQENGTEVHAFRGNESLLKMTLGKPASSYRHTFVLLGEDHRVYHADGNLRNEFNRTVQALRDKKVMTLSDEIVELTLQKDSESLTMVKETVPVTVGVTAEEEKEPVEPAAPAWVIPGGKPVKQQQVDELISTLSNLECDGYIENTKKKDYTSPAYTVTLKGANTYSLLIFEKQDGQYPAISSQNDYPFLLSEWKASRIMKDLNSLTEEEK